MQKLNNLSSNFILKRKINFQSLLLQFGIILLFLNANIAQTCIKTDYLYLNDVQNYVDQGFVHKFRIENSGTLTEVGGVSGMPWVPPGAGLGSPHGLGQDLNGNLYIGAHQFNGPIAKIKCDGTISNLNFINDAGFNIVSKDGYLYVNSSINDRITRYSLCDGSEQGYVLLNDVPNFNYDDSPFQADWGLEIDPDGTIYASSGFALNQVGGKRMVFRFNPSDADFINHTSYSAIINSDVNASLKPGAGYDGISSANDVWGITHDNAGNMYVLVWDNEFGLFEETWILKFNSSGTLIGSTLEKKGDRSLSGYEGARGILYYPALDILYLGAGPDGDCVAIVNPNNLSYVGAAIGNVPNQNPKTLRIASEACPILTSTSIKETLCDVKVGDKIFLQTIVGSCTAPICGGNWTADAGNVGMTFNQCDLSFTITSMAGCGKFLLNNTGGVCGNFAIELNVDFGNVKAPIITGNQTVCASSQDPIAFGTSTPASGSGAIQYQWQKSTTSCNADFNDIAGATSATYDPPVVNQTTYYRVIATVFGGCTVANGSCTDISNCVTITTQTCNNCNLNAACNSNAVTNCSPVNGTASVTVTGGQGTITYLWSSGENTSSISGKGAGTYTVTVTDSFLAGCTATCQAVITNTITLPTASCNQTDNTNCGTPNGTASVTTNGNQIAWSTGANTASITGLSAGTYTVTITNTTTGCTNTCQSVITKNTNNPTVTCSKTDNTNCATPNGSATATATGVTYLWSNNATTSTITGLSNGTYTVTVTSTTSGCTATCSAIVGSTATLPTATCSKTDNTNCATPNGTASVTTDGNQIAWSTGATTANITGLSAGTYTVTVTNTVTGCTNTCQSVVGSTTTLPTASCSKTDNTNCTTPNGTASVTTDGNQIAWSTGATTANITGLSAGTYTVTVTNTTTGCTNTCQAVVGSTTTLPTASCSKTDNTNCTTPNGTASVATDGNQIAWSTDATTANITGLSAGTYTVTVTNTTTGCTNTCQSIVANSTVSPTCNIIVNTQPTCANLIGGSVSVTPSPVGTYTYVWSNAAVTATVTGLAGGTYTVTVTSTTTGCTGVCQATLNTPMNCCDINAATIISYDCLDNATPAKITDNRLQVGISVTNVSSSLTTYNVTVQGNTTTVTPNSGTYGTPTLFTLGAGSAGGGATFTLVLTDAVTGASCSRTVSITDPKNCTPATPECPTPKCGFATIQVNGN